ncbi:MAG: hypothetical protein N2484_03020 [Clostridia bacterium]|nr:hypothetical protein [Clostridia bacterium]
MPDYNLSTTPWVIMDIDFEDGLLFISVQNISDVPAYKVSVVFRESLLGVEGAKDISKLPLFKNIEFLAPHKKIRTFLDTSASFFKHNKTAIIHAVVSYQCRDHKKFTEAITHDLEIYKQIGYIKISGQDS